MNVRITYFSPCVIRAPKLQKYQATRPYKQVAAFHCHDLSFPTTDALVAPANEPIYRQGRKRDVYFYLPLQEFYHCSKISFIVRAVKAKVWFPKYRMLVKLYNKRSDDFLWRTIKSKVS